MQNVRILEVSPAFQATKQQFLFASDKAVLSLEKGAYPKNSHVLSFKPFMSLDLDVCACCALKGGTQAALITDTDCTNTSALINESRVPARSRGGR